MELKIDRDCLLSSGTTLFICLCSSEQRIAFARAIITKHPQPKTCVNKSHAQNRVIIRRKQ